MPVHKKPPSLVRAKFGTRRLWCALAFSLLLHLLLLLLLRFESSGGSGFFAEPIPLHVLLEQETKAEARPVAIAQATQDAKGKQLVGVQEKNKLPPRELSVAKHAPVKQYRKSIPKTFIGQKILAVKRPQKVHVVESVPDLLVTKTVPVQADEPLPFAPAASVQQPKIKVTPSHEQLVGAVLMQGERQEKIILAESAQKKSEQKKAGNSADEARPAKSSETPPAPVEEVKPAKSEPPKLEPALPAPVKTEPVKAEAAPTKVEPPKPVPREVVQPPQPAPVAEAKPAATKAPPPMPVEEAKPAKAEAGKSGAGDAAKTAAGEGAKAEAGRGDAASGKTSSLADLSFAALKKIAREEPPKMQFGERRKNVGLKEQDFRYAMYIESVRQKLQRIGAFNYPTAAARANLSGGLGLRISIRADGSLEEVSTVRPSPHEVLNSAAERIVKMCAPFSPFPDNIRRDTDVLSITLSWSFANSSQVLE